MRWGVSRLLEFVRALLRVFESRRRTTVCALAQQNILLMEQLDNLLSAPIRFRHRLRILSRLRQDTILSNQLFQFRRGIHGDKLGIYLIIDVSLKRAGRGP